MDKICPSCLASFSGRTIKIYCSTRCRDVASNKRNYKKNRTKILARTKQRQLDNPEKWYCYTKKWKNANKDKVAINKRNRKTRLKGSLGSFSHLEWELLKAVCNHTCLRCLKSEPTIKLTADHIIPIYLGGSNCISNIQPLCGSCNASKGVKILDYRATIEALCSQ